MNYGSVTFENDFWIVTGKPHVMIKFKRVFKRVDKTQVGTAKLDDTLENCADLLWFLQRYPMEMSKKDAAILKRRSQEHFDHLETMSQVIAPDYVPPKFDLALPLRNYQSVAVDLYLKQKWLLLGDELGLGKTVTIIGSFTDPRTLPAVVLCPIHLLRQWRDMIERFCPRLYTHIIKKGENYEMKQRDGREPDVYIINYHKIHKWVDFLGSRCKSICFDEGQELRRTGSDKYMACRNVAAKMEYRIAATATPIYNYGGEIINVLNILNEDCLGSHEEFHREWCSYLNNDKWALDKPDVFGHYLRDNFIMLRRTRAEVGRELPPLSKIAHEIDCDTSALDKIKNSATELARIILARSEEYKGARMQASSDLDNMVRQATGISKAPYVADFVRMLVENGEQVALFLWHREVYTIILEKLKDLNPVMYTGSESQSQKEQAKSVFVAKQSPVILISLRSGAGLDGLQHVCSTVVLGELDWSPGVTEQCIGRVFRDGQPSPVNAYFLLSSGGSDPLMAEVLGVKRDQIEGINNPDKVIERLQIDPDHIKKLARAYLKDAPEPVAYDFVP